MSRQDKYNDMKREFRRLSIGRAKLADRISFLREMLKFAKSNCVAGSEEIEGLEKDLKKYELHWILNVCEDLSQGRNTNVSLGELKKRYEIAVKFSSDIQENPDYINAFNKIQRSYRFRSKMENSFYALLVCFLLATVGWCGIWLFSNYQLNSIASRLNIDSTGSISSQAGELFQIQKELKEKGWLLLHEKQRLRHQNLQNKCFQKIQTCRDHMLGNITASVGNTKRYCQEVQTFLKIFPDEALSSHLDLEIVPRIPEYETILTFNRYWNASQGVEFPTTFSLDASLKSPTFLPEWHFISQYGSFHEQIALAKEKELFKWLENFFAKHDYAVVTEWGYCCKNWTRCYYSSEPPTYSEEKKNYSMMVSLPDGEVKEVRFARKPERAYYTDFAHARWYALAQFQKKNYSLCELIHFWLSFLQKTAEDKQLDPLFKSYYLAHTIQRLKLFIPTLYDFYLKEIWEGRAGISEFESILVQFKNLDLIAPPETKPDKVITDNLADNLRRMKAIELNNKLLQEIAAASKNSLLEQVATYRWIGWVLDGKVNVKAEEKTDSGSLLVLKWDAPSRKADLVTVGEVNDGSIMLSSELKGMDFQPLWLRCPTRGKIDTANGIQ